MTLLALIESCRQMGHGALAGGEDPADVLDRMLDHLQGFVLDNDDLGSSPEGEAS